MKSAVNTNCFFALFLWASVSEAVEPPLSRSADTRAQHLLQEFAAGQMKLLSFIIESENTSEFGTNRSQFCFDARAWRSANRITTWGKAAGDDQTRKDQPSYTSHLWDGRAFYTYTRNPESAVGLSPCPRHHRPGTCGPLRLHSGTWRRRSPGFIFRIAVDAKLRHSFVKADHHTARPFVSQQFDQHRRETVHRAYNT